MKNLFKIMATCSLMLCLASPAFADSSEDDTKEVVIEKIQQTKAILESIDDSDYDTFLELTADTKISEKINEDNFETLVSAYQLLKDGDKEAAKELFSELDVRPTKKKQKRIKKVHQVKTVLDAIDAGDYDAWLDAVPENGKITEIINEENFEDFVYAHEVLKDGDKETAEELFEELGLKPPRKHFGKKLDNHITNNEDQ